MENPKQEKLEKSQESSKNIPLQERGEEGDIVVIDGKKYRKEHSGYTIREYFSHHTESMGPGPGWDSRHSLSDDEYAMRYFGRTFSRDQMSQPNSGSDKLPDDPYYVFKLIED